MQLSGFDPQPCGPATLDGRILPPAQPLPGRDPTLVRSDEELAKRRSQHSLPTGNLVDMFFDPTMRRADDQYGFKHGTPIDRLYIHDMLVRFAPLCGGHVAVVEDPGYALRLQELPQLRQKITDITVLDVDASNPKANMRADLSIADSLPKSVFDTVICLQTLQYMPNSIRTGIANLSNSLAPNGIAILTVPASAPIDANWPQDRQRWVARGLHEQFSQVLDPEQYMHCTLSYGNKAALQAFHWPITVEDLEARIGDELEAGPESAARASKQARLLIMHNDRTHPVTIGCVIKRRPDR
jgi:hypothetical protein